MDQRNIRLADLLTDYSCSVKEGENVLIEYEGAESRDLVTEIIKDVYKKGAKPFVNINDSVIEREIMLGCSDGQMASEQDYLMHQMKMMDAYIAIRGTENSSEQADVPQEKQNLYNKYMEPVVDERCDNTKWCVLRYPNAAMAQLAGTSQEKFSDFYYKVCTLDYAKMSRAMDPLKELMDRTDRVEINGPDTHLEFSIKDIPAVKCDGRYNIPDGEVYTAPVKDSMNGYIHYNTVSQEQGFTFSDIRFEIKDGKIVKAEANDNDRINAMLDTDDGARYFGEFSFGLNPYILEPMKDTLFDEKIAGSFHLTPGMCYEDAYNGNKSAVHWDLVMIQRPEHGGGEILFDGKLVRKDGRFVMPELDGLNPENLK
jgi:aminopeptidase